MINFPSKPEVFVCLAIVSAMALSGTTYAQEVETLDQPELPSWATRIEGAELSDDSVWWALFVQISQMERQRLGTGVGLLHQIGLTNLQADTLVAHIQQSTDAINAKVQNESESRCAQMVRSTAPAAVASKMAETDKDLELARKTKIEGLRQILDSKAEEKLRAYLEEEIRPNLSQVSFDYDAYISENGVDAIMQRCSEGKDGGESGD